MKKQLQVALVSLGMLFSLSSCAFFESVYDHLEAGHRGIQNGIAWVGTQIEERRSYGNPPAARRYEVPNQGYSTRTSTSTRSSSSRSSSSSSRSTSSSSSSKPKPKPKPKPQPKPEPKPEPPAPAADEDATPDGGTTVGNGRATEGDTPPADTGGGAGGQAPAGGFSDLPFAQPVPGKTGYVTLPGRKDLPEIDVRGIEPGTPVEIPDPGTTGSTIKFKVP